MKTIRLLLILLTALAASACARQGYYRAYSEPVVVHTVRPVAYVAEPAYPVYRYRETRVINEVDRRPVRIIEQQRYRQSPGVIRRDQSTGHRQKSSTHAIQSSTVREHSADRRFSDSSDYGYHKRSSKSVERDFRERSNKNRVTAEGSAANGRGRKERNQRDSDNRDLRRHGEFGNRVDVAGRSSDKPRKSDSWDAESARNRR